MRAYVCDACGVTMTDPYNARMREFYIGWTENLTGFESRRVKTFKQTVHLCDDCYHALHEIAKEKANA